MWNSQEGYKYVTGQIYVAGQNKIFIISDKWYKWHVSFDDSYEAWLKLPNDMRSRLIGFHRKSIAHVVSIWSMQRVLLQL